MQTFDVLVIGAGPAGYVAAIRCAQLGFKTACVERWIDDAGKPALGGTCLNVGCIPSKALLDSSHHYWHLHKHAAEHGIKTGNISMDVATMQTRKQKVVAKLTRGVAMLFKKHKVQWLQGSASFVDNTKVAVTGTTGKTVEIGAQHIIIATGSVPMAVPVAAVDGERVVDSTGALAFSAVPKRLGVIGAGVIGLELGSVWNRLGAEVVIFEATEAFLPIADPLIAREALREMKKQGLDIRLGTKVTGIAVSRAEVSVDYADKNGSQAIGFDKLVVAVGRRPNTDGLALDKVSIATNPRGFIEINDHWQTGAENIYAIGDCVRGPMLAHKGSEEGIAVAEQLAGQAGHVNYATIPWVIYTWPEIAWVGQSEQTLKDAGINYRAGVFPFAASGRALAMGEAAGKVKILADAATDTILGVHIFGPNASELIAEAVTAMEFGASADDLARTVHAHPTLSEALHEAALAVDGRAIHT